MKNRVVPFVVAKCLGHHSQAANGSTVRDAIWTVIYDCLAVRAWISLHPRLDLRPEHRSGFRRTIYLGHTPGTTCWPIEMPARANPAHAAPSPFRDHLRLVAHVARSYYRPDRRGMSQAPARAQFPIADNQQLISGDRNKKHPLTHPRVVSQFGTVFYKTHWQALSGLSCLSFSRSQF